MSAPRAPVIRGLDGALADPLAPLLLAKDKFSHADNDLPLSATLAAQNMLGNDGWGWPSYFLGADGTQAQMAFATKIGAWYQADFVGGSFGVSGDVVDVRLQIRGAHTWPTPPGYGYGLMRVHLNHDSSRLRWEGAAANVAYVGGSTPALTMIDQSILAVVQDIFGKNEFTVAELEALWSVLTVDVITWEGTESYITTFRGCLLQLEVRYLAAKIQHHAQQWDFATDTLFASVIKTTGKLYSEDEALTLQPEDLESGAGGDVYGRAYTWDDATDTQSPASDTVTLTVLSMQAARLLHDPSGAVPVLAIGFGRWLESARWSQTSVDEDGNAVSSTFQAALTQAGEPHHNWWLADFWEDGVAGGYTEVSTIAAVEATASTFYRHLTTEVVYIHTSDGRCPAAFKARGIKAICRMPVSFASVACGPNNHYRSLPWLKGSPKVTQTLGSLSRGLPVSLSGSVTISNESETFYQLLALDQDEVHELWLDTSAGWLSNEAPVECRLCGTTTAGPVQWDDGPVLFEGFLTWPRANLLRAEQVTLGLRGKEVLKGSLPRDVYSEQQYANLLEREAGTGIGERLGTHVFGAKLTVVDTVNGVLRTGRSIPYVARIKYNGAEIPSSVWSYDATTNHITLTLPIVVAGFDIDVEELASGTWTFDGAGELVDGLSTITAAGVAEWLLDRADEPAANIATATFTARDTDAINVNDGGWTYDCRVVLDEPREIRDLLQIAMQSGSFHVVHRPADQSFVAMAESPDDLGPSTVILEDRHVLDSEPGWSYDTEDVGSPLTVSYWPWLESSPIEVPAFTFFNQAQVGIDRLKQLETFLLDRVGAWKRAQALHTQVPQKHATLTVPLFAWLAHAGATVALSLAYAMSSSGEASWALCQVRETSLDLRGLTVHQVVRWRRELARRERPR